jgi:lysozyme
MAAMRRRIFKGIAAVVVVAALSPLTLNVLWPLYRPPLKDGETYGLDVSSHQGAVDWRAVSADGISAAYIKASEGATWKDSQFAANWTGATAAGLRVGAYHFFTLCRSGEEQAENFLSMLRQVQATAPPRTLAPVVDLELSGNCSERPSREVVNDRLETFVEAVESESGQRVVYYVLDNFEALYPIPPHLQRERWERSLAVRPDGDWVWWQVHNGASVDGVDGPVDLNVLDDPPG